MLFRFLASNVYFHSTGGYRYPSQGNSGYPNMYPNSNSGLPRPAGYPPYGPPPMQQQGPPYYNDNAGSPVPQTKGGAVQAAQAVVATAESQSKASPRPPEIMNGPRNPSMPAGQMPQLPVQNHTGPLENTAIKQEAEASSVKSGTSTGQ